MSRHGEPWIVVNESDIDTATGDNVCFDNRCCEGGFQKREDAERTVACADIHLLQKIR